MPYIPAEDRPALDAYQRQPETVGELNYLLTRQLKRGLDVEALWTTIELYLDARRESYALYNDVMGVLDCAGREHARRGWAGVDTLALLANRLYLQRVAPYEDKKILENGDV